MSSYAIISDSTCDLDRTLRNKYDIDYACMNFILNDTEYEASLDWEKISASEFYNAMRAGGIIKTTQVPADVFTTKFKKYLELDMDVLYIACSSALSGSVNIAKKIADELMREYPGRKIYCLDSLISSFGQGMIVMSASVLRSEGKSLDETIEFLESNKLRFNQCGTTEKLEYLKRAGRVTASSAFFGNLFGVKPLIISDAIGQNYAVRKVKGMNSARVEIAKMIAEAAKGSECRNVFISHADNEESAKMLKECILEQMDCEVYIGYIGPIVGASVGPGTIIAFCYGSEVTIQGEA